MCPALLDLTFILQLRVCAALTGLLASFDSNHFEPVTFSSAAKKK
jgi:hypothetical protein